MLELYSNSNYMYQNKYSWSSDFIPWCQESVNYGPQGKSGQPTFVNKVLLNIAMLTHLQIVCDGC